MACPPKPSDTKHSLLVVYLANWSEEKEENLVQHLPSLKDVQITKWHPSDAFLQSVAPQGQHQDSQANIYAVAIAAFQSGWSEFVVADGLTRRQIKGVYRNGDKPLISVAGVSVKLGQQESEVQVIARRITGKDDKTALSLDTLRNLSLSRDGDLADISPETGFVLHDPGRSLFAADTISRAGESSPAWPYDGEEKPSIPSFLPKDKQSLNIFLLFPTTPEQLQSMQSTIQQAAEAQAKEKCNSKSKVNSNNDDKAARRPPTAQLASWDHTQTPSRRDIVRMWEAYTRHIDHPDTMHFLPHPFQESDTTTAQFLTVYDNFDAPLLVAKNTLTTVINESLHLSNRYTEIEPQAKQHSHFELELLSPPTIPFYTNPTPWNPISEGLISIPLFYLTQSLPRSQHRILESEIQTPTDVDVPNDTKTCCFVSWPHPQDGNLASIWEIFWEMRSYRRSKDYREPPYLFIDKQSAVDKTLIVIHPDHYFGFDSNETAQDILADIEEPDIRGILYGRIPGREAHSVWANLRIANMGFEDFFEGREDEIVKIQRPGWPGHGVLRNSDSEEGSEDEMEWETKVETEAE
ncbi:hypothetical protein BDW59DRAFT_148691 [Aspergillus cavernicola]|uniref:Uncharacterized protein n=1 Tax=Aspergillus cavernicola TaxID=176166 RepID=A0ABR4I9E6_9EURO